MKSSLAVMVAAAFALVVMSGALFAAKLPAAPVSPRDFAALSHYQAADSALEASGVAPRVVFIGDSVTAHWADADAALFGHGIVNRGIGGQVSAQLLLRFRQDVVELHPRAVHIMVGTNDIAQVGGVVPIEQTENNIRDMAELARANGIGVILGSVTPCDHFPGRDDLHPAPTIRALNAWLKSYAAATGATFVDYGQVLATPTGAMKPGYSEDGVHPLPSAYNAMAPLVEQAIRPYA
jgi:lysophospholipase L1-like esterase